MVINNPYIQKVSADPDILTEPEIIYSHQGNWSEYFGNTYPLVLEIGTGMGNWFGKNVGEQPEKNFIGIELRYKRLFSTARKAREGVSSLIDKEGLREVNFVVIQDMGQNVEKIFQKGELSQTHIYFPDPWANKDRQRKNRLLQKDFLTSLSEVTQTGGKLFFKTDHREYFDSTLEILKEIGLWKTLRISYNYEEDEVFDMSSITEFESYYRGVKQDICYIELERV